VRTETTSRISWCISINEQQDNVNEALKTKGSIYRIHGIDIEMGIPPKIVYAIRREFDEQLE